MKLEDEADVSIAERNQLPITDASHVDVADLNVTRIRAIQATEQVQQRALPRSRRTNDGHHFSPGHLQIQIANDVQPIVRDQV